MNVFVNKKKEARWLCNIYCNFSCPYCFASKSNPDPRKNIANIGNPNIEPVVNFFNETGPWEIWLAGGEPFLHPRFMDICFELTKKHNISLNTNLSSPFVYEFADKIDPSRVGTIIASLQIPEIERLDLKDDYIKKFKYLEKKGFNICSNLVSWPPVVARLEEIYSYFEKSGIKIQPTHFIGDYKGRHYPESYTQDEINFIKNVTKIDIENSPYFTKGKVTYKGQDCLAGNRHIIVFPNGNVTRCYSNKVSLGNIFENNVVFFDKPEKCQVAECMCPSEGLMFSCGKDE